ncbi:hypothetical protein BD413DRAFT_575109, partial [Trametes elegans]
MSHEGNKPIDRVLAEGKSAPPSLRPAYTSARPARGPTASFPPIGLWLRMPAPPTALPHGPAGTHGQPAP